MEDKRELKRIAEGLKECFSVFAALGEENRQQILVAILESGCSGLRVPDITAEVNLSRPAVSHHLMVLKQAGLVAARREGTKNFYYVSADKDEWEKIINLVQSIDKLIKNAYIK